MTRSFAATTDSQLGSFDRYESKDTTCRVENAQRIVEAAPNACLEVFEGEGYYVIFDNLQKLCKALRCEDAKD